MRPLSILIFSLLVLSGCKKDSDSPRWDVNILAPLFKATIGVDDLVPDSLRQVAPDGAVTLVFDSTIYSTPVDSVFEIKDTLESTIFLSPGVIALTPGFVFYSQPEELDLDLNSIELSEAIVKQGYARLVAKNHLATPVIYTFNMPTATLNGVPFQKIQTLDAAPPNGVTVFDGRFDMTGYHLDLTGNTGSNYNHLSYSVVGQTSPTGTTVNLAFGDTVVDITSGFESLMPLYAKGYLGQGTFSVATSNSIGSGKIDGGLIDLDSISVTLTIKNSVGADAQAKITSMKSVNDRTGVSLDLVAPAFINQTLNLNRATETGTAPSPVNSTYYTVQIDNTNSNIIQLLENLPDRLEYNMDFNLNPLGNVSGHHDFLYTDDIFDADLKVTMPLRFAANQILFADTQDVAAIDQTSDDNLGDGVFTLVAENGFPWELEVQLILVNSAGAATDSLLVPNLIAPAPLDGNYRAIGTAKTIIPIPLSTERRNNLMSADRIAVRARLSTSAYPQILQIYDDYVLSLKLIGDFTYKIQ